MLLGKMALISKLDLKCIYNQILIDPICRYITAFCTHLGVFQYKQLNFGIYTVAELALAGLDGALKISDDVIVFGRNQEEHDARLYHVLQWLHQKGFMLKCVFLTDQLDFFGMAFLSKKVRSQSTSSSRLQKPTKF